LLDANISAWIREKSAQVVRVSQQVASDNDWSLVDTIPKEKNSLLFEKYRNALRRLSQERFPHNEGAVYLAVVERGEAYVVDPGDPHPLDDFGKANRYELAAYSSGKTTYNEVPFSDDTGTYIEALTPISRNGRVVGLVGAEYDSAQLPELRELVLRAFWLSILPAILCSLAVAYILASMFVEPMEIFRRIDNTNAEKVGSSPGTLRDDPLIRLSPREKEIAELVRRGLKNKEIAEALVVAPETVKQHLKNIREKTGLTRVDLAVQAEARRILSAQQSSTFP
jgi:DNA-binding NarL/FixJ family response regulator